MPMYTRRSGRAITSDFSKSFVPSGTANPNTVPAAMPAEPAPVSVPVAEPEPLVSAESADAAEQDIPKWKKNARAPKALRKKKLNARLSKIMTPKPALAVLNELIPGVQVSAIQSPATLQFMSEIVYNKEIIATAVGRDKSSAQTSAAVAALKKLFSDFMLKSQEATTSQAENVAEPMEVSEGAVKNAKNSIPWFNLASFAMYRLLNDWKEEGVNVPLKEDSEPSVPKTHVMPPISRLPPPKKELPPNHATMHPSLLFNHMVPGVNDVVLKQTPPPNSSVTVAYNINGQTYSGTATNRKAARKAAACVALRALYGLEFPPEPIKPEDM